MEIDFLSSKEKKKVTGSIIHLLIFPAVILVCMKIKLLKLQMLIDSLE
jgi:hypothetical protein